MHSIIKMLPYVHQSQLSGDVFFHGWWVCVGGDDKKLSLFGLGGLVGVIKSKHHRTSIMPVLIFRVSKQKRCMMHLYNRGFGL